MELFYALIPISVVVMIFAFVGKPNLLLRIGAIFQLLVVITFCIAIGVRVKSDILYTHVVANRIDIKTSCNATIPIIFNKPVAITYETQTYKSWSIHDDKILSIEINEND